MKTYFNGLLLMKELVEVESYIPAQYGMVVVEVLPVVKNQEN